MAASTEPWKLDKARRYADKIADQLSPFCHRLMLAGSCRRKRPLVNDIDFVVVPSDRAGLEARLRQGSQLVKNGPAMIQAITPAGIQLDLYVAHNGSSPTEDLFESREPDPTNWGSILLCRTGSRFVNACIADLARKKGYEWVIQRGLCDGGARGKVIASKTEEEIFAALGMRTLQAWEREDWPPPGPVLAGKEAAGPRDEPADGGGEG